MKQKNPKIGREGPILKKTYYLVIQTYQGWAFFVFMAFEWSDDNATKLKFQNKTGLSGLHISNHHNHHHNDHKLHNSGKVDHNRPRSHSYDATQRLKIKPSN